MAIPFYPLTIVPKQKRATEKPRETTVDSVDTIPAKLHTHTPIIAPVARIRIASLRRVEKKVAFGIHAFSSAVMGVATGKPSRSTYCDKCSSQGFDNPRSHLETALPDIPSIAPSSDCVKPRSFLFRSIISHIFSM